MKPSPDHPRAAANPTGDMINACLFHVDCSCLSFFRIDFGCILMINFMYPMSPRHLASLEG
jgi:hypothetical protein